MNLAEIFIRRPIMTLLVTLAILLFGITAYRFLPVNDLPNVDYPTLSVFASLPGASPETMASSVATPLERQFSTIAGLTSMNSTNSQGSTSITLQFDLSRNLDAAAQDVQAMISQAEVNLPPGMPAPPSYQKVNPADQPIIYMSVSSATLPLSLVHQYADTFMAQRISMISGVAQVQVFGEQKYAVRVQLDPKALATRGIGIDEVTEAIQKGNVNLPTGTVYGAYKTLTLEATGQLENAAAYRPLIVAYRNGSPVLLGEIANVVDSVQNDKVAAWYNDTRAEVLAIRRQPGTNTVQVVDNIKRILPSIRSQIPAGIEMQILYDRSETIRESVNDVKLTLYLTVCLVVLVIFLFLRNLSATLIPSLALPMSIIGTFAVMFLLGYTVDNLSLMALTLSVGFVVDDAIVMLENIVRHMELGEGVREAALSGSKEISFTILSMTLSLVAVFIPVLFMGGILGRLLHEFAVTISAAILVSGFVSLTLTPMQRVFLGIRDAYDRSLQGVLRHRLATLFVSFLLIAATVYLFIQIPKGFLPSEDSGLMFGITEAQQGISVGEMRKHQEAVVAIIAKDPNVLNTFSLAGAGFAGFSANSGLFFVHLRPHPERQMTTDEVIEQLRPKLFTVPGILAFMQNPPPIEIGGRLTKSPYQYTLVGADPKELYRTASQLQSKMDAVPGLQDVTTDLEIANPQVNIQIDRPKAAALGLTAFQIEDALSTAYGERQISTIYAPNDEYRVITELKAEYQADASAVSMLYVHSANGRLVPLDAVARSLPELGPLS
ncbi:MAG: acriflavine resistance protein B, partial [Acidobacteria bacterium]